MISTFHREMLMLKMRRKSLEKLQKISMGGWNHCSLKSNEPTSDNTDILLAKQRGYSGWELNLKFILEMNRLIKELSSISKLNQNVTYILKLQ